MTLHQAIERGIEGGWHPTYRTLPHLSKFATDKEVLLDPSFWRALSKAEGWEGDTSIMHDDVQVQWVLKMHALVDHLCEGKSIESFFEKL